MIILCIRLSSIIPDDGPEVRVTKALFIMPPTSTKLSVCLSFCPSVDGIVTVLYLQQYLLDAFYIHISYQATSEGVTYIYFFSKFQNLNVCQMFYICNFEFVSFDWHESIVWVIMGQHFFFLRMQVI